MEGCITPRSLQLKAGGQGDLGLDHTAAFPSLQDLVPCGETVDRQSCVTCVLPHPRSLLWSWDGHSKRNVLFEKSAGVWNVDQLLSPACRQPDRVAGTELHDLIVLQMRCEEWLQFLSFCCQVI